MHTFLVGNFVLVSLPVLDNMHGARTSSATPISLHIWIELSVASSLLLAIDFSYLEGVVCATKCAVTARSHERYGGMRVC